MKTHVLLFGVVLPLATTCAASAAPTTCEPVGANGAAAAKAGKDAYETPAAATPATPATKPTVQKRDGRALLPAYLFM